MSLYFTVLTTFLLLTACGAKSTGGTAASSVPLGSGNTPPASLVAATSASSVSPGTTATLSVIGGTGPYNWVVTSGGGTLSSSSGTSVIFTAGNTPGMAYITVSDSAGASGTVSVNVSGTTTTTPPTDGKVCQGNYAVTLGTYAAAAQLTTTGGTLNGILVYGGHQYPLQGTCTAMGVAFTLIETGDTFTGTFGANGGAPRAPITGTYLNVYYGSTQTWTATPQ